MTQSRSSYRQNPASLRFDAKGLDIHYLDWGEGSERHLVLLHGLGSQAHAWDRFAKDASDAFRVVAPDLRGHGESAHAEDGYALKDFSADAHALARHLNLPPFDLVGHSLGAMIAIRFAADHPSMVEHLVLVDGGPGLDLEIARQGSAVSFMRPLGWNTQDEAKAWHRKNFPERPAEWVEQRVTYGMKQNWSGKWVFRHDPELYWILEGGVPLSEEQSLGETLAKLRCPVLVLRGERSPLLSLAAARRIAKAPAKGKLLEIAGAGHGIPSDAPERFRDAVLEFLLA